MVIDHPDRTPARPPPIPLGGMKGRGGAEPPRHRRPPSSSPSPIPHTPYPIPLKRRALQRCCSERARQRLRRTRRHVPPEVTTPLEVTTPPDATPRSRPRPRPTRPAQSATLSRASGRRDSAGLSPTTPSSTPREVFSPARRRRSTPTVTA